MSKDMAVEKRGFSITEFCKMYGISRATYYNLKNDGNVPKIMTINSHPIMTMAAIQEWEAKNTKP